MVLSCYLVVFACSDPSQPDEPGPAPGFTVAMTTASALPIVQGQTVTTIVRVTRVGGFDGPVVIAADSAPAGVTVPTVEVGAFEEIPFLSVSVDFDVPVGRVVVPLRATGAGVAEVSASLVLEVAAAPPPELRVSVNTPIVSVVSGDSAPLVARVERIGRVRGPVVVGVVVPAGLPIRISPVELLEGRDTVSLWIVTEIDATNSQPGLIITASHPDAVQATATFQVSIRQAPPLRFAMTPPFVAVRPGAPEQATLSVVRSPDNYAGPVEFSLLTPPTGVLVSMVVDPSGERAVLTVDAAISTLPQAYPVQVEMRGFGRVVDTASLTVTVAPPGNLAHRFGADGGSPLMFVYRDGEGGGGDSRPGDMAVPLGFGSPRTRVVWNARQFHIDDPPQGFERVLLVRPNPMNGPPRLLFHSSPGGYGPVIPGLLDFNGLTGRDGAVRTATLENGNPAVPIVVSTAYRRSQCTDLLPCETDTLSAGTTAFPWLAFASTVVASGDVAVVTARELVAPDAEVEREVSAVLVQLSNDRRVTLPEAPSAPVVTSTDGTLGSAVIRAELPQTGRNERRWLLRYAQSGGLRVTISADSAWTGGGRMPTSPDITLAQWQSAWRLRAGVATSWSLQATWTTIVPLGLDNTRRFNRAVRRGTLVP
jgi:hypothetical protein